MHEEPPRDNPDFALKGLARQDLSALSVDDLRERIRALEIEIERCEEALDARANTRLAAERLFRG